MGGESRRKNMWEPEEDSQKGLQWIKKMSRKMGRKRVKEGEAVPINDGGVGNLEAIMGNMKVGKGTPVKKGR